MPAFKSDDWLDLTFGIVYAVENPVGGGPNPIPHVATISVGEIWKSGSDGQQSIVQSFYLGWEIQPFPSPTPGPNSCGDHLVIAQPPEPFVIHGGTLYVSGDFVSFGGAVIQVVTVLSGGTVTALGLVSNALFPLGSPTTFFPTGGSGSGLEAGVIYNTERIIAGQYQGFSNGHPIGKFPVGGLTAVYKGGNETTFPYEFGPIALSFKPNQPFINANGDTVSRRGQLLKACPTPDVNAVYPGNIMAVNGNVASQFPTGSMANPSGKTNLWNFLYNELLPPTTPSLPTNGFQWAQKGHIIRGLVYFDQIGPLGPCPA